MSAMALPIIPHTIRCAISGTCPNGAPWVNVIHVVKNIASTFAAAEAAIDAELTHLYGETTPYGAGTAGFVDYGSTSARFLQVSYTPLDGLSAASVLNRNVAGIAAATPMPSGVAAVVTHRTGFRGRSKRGRTYLAGFTEASNDTTGLVQAALVTEILAAWNAFNAAVVAHADLDQFCVASYVNSSQEAVLTTTMDSSWDHQDRRKA